MTRPLAGLALALAAVPTAAGDMVEYIREGVRARDGELADGWFDLLEIQYNNPEIAANAPPLPPDAPPEDRLGTLPERAISARTLWLAGTVWVERARALYPVEEARAYVASCDGETIYQDRGGVGAAAPVERGPFVQVYCNWFLDLRRCRPENCPSSLMLSSPGLELVGTEQVGEHRCYRLESPVGARSLGTWWVCEELGFAVVMYERETQAVHGRPGVKAIETRSLWIADAWQAFEGLVPGHRVHLPTVVRELYVGGIPTVEWYHAREVRITRLHANEGADPRYWAQNIARPGTPVVHSDGRPTFFVGGDARRWVGAAYNGIPMDPRLLQESPRSAEAIAATDPAVPEVPPLAAP